MFICLTAYYGTKNGRDRLVEKLQAEIFRNGPANNRVLCFMSGKNLNNSITEFYWSCNYIPFEWLMKSILFIFSIFTPGSLFSKNNDMFINLSIVSRKFYGWKYLLNCLASLLLTFTLNLKHCLHFPSFLKSQEISQKVES